MSVQRLLRRPSNPILIAISGALILLFILFTAGPSNIQTTTRYFGSGSSSSSLLDDIFNTTLGVSRFVGCPKPVLRIKPDGSTSLVREDISRGVANPYRPS
jgi:hypothetical protein